MEDPLNNFDWTRLYERYDARCIGFNKGSLHLNNFDLEKLDRPTSDRELYYKLLTQFSAGQRNLHAKPIAVYEELLYWKLYSQRAAIFNLEFRWLPKGSGLRNDAQERFIQLLHKLPASLEKSPSVIIDLVRWLGKFQLPGMASSSAIPVRTTFLHIVYPSIVPIFDQMVLRAVGRWEKGANHKYNVLEEYLPFAWDLAEKYKQQASLFTKESPIRVIDMALWVNRGAVG